MVAAEWGTGQVFLSLLVFFGVVLIVWLMITIFGDIVRSDDLSGWGKAMWSLVVLLLPIFGVIAYLVVRGGQMHERQESGVTPDYSRDGVPSNERWASARIMTQG